MALLSAQDEQTLTQHLCGDRQAGHTAAVHTDDRRIGERPGSQADPDEVARLNDKITVEEKNFVLDVEDRTKYGVDKAPAIVVLS